MELVSFLPRIDLCNVFLTHPNPPYLATEYPLCSSPGQHRDLPVDKLREPQHVASQRRPSDPSDPSDPNDGDGGQRQQRWPFHCEMLGGWLQQSQILS